MLFHVRCPRTARKLQAGRTNSAEAGQTPATLDTKKIPPGVVMPKNPRSTNGNLRRKYRARLKAMGAECGICHGRLGPIHYDEPSDAKHPLSFVIDEIRPVSKWRLFGYPSPQAAAQDWNNVQAAHYICNSAKSDKIAPRGTPRIVPKTVPDGQW